VPGSAAIVTDTLEQLTPRAATAESVGKVFAAASKRLRGLVPHDASVWLATDPATGMPTAPARSEQLGAICTGDARSCLRVWELEFTVHDVNLYRDLARSTTPAGALRLATRDRPARSPRYREFLKPNGFGDELRAVMRVNGAAWASIGLFREHGRPAFSAHETALLAGLSEPLAAAVRAHAQPATETAATGEDRGPGLMVFDRDGELISANDEALAWLEELPPDTGDPGSFSVRLPWSSSARSCVPGPSPTSTTRARARTTALSLHGLLAGLPCLLPAQRRRHGRQHRAGHRASEVLRDRPNHRPGLPALHPRAADHATDRARSPDRRDRLPASSVDPHCPRLHQGPLRQGQRRQPRRAGRQDLRRALRPAAPRARSQHAHRRAMTQGKTTAQADDLAAVLALRT